MEISETNDSVDVVTQPDFRRLMRHIERARDVFSMVFVIWDRADTERDIFDAVRACNVAANVERLQLPSGDAIDIFHRIEEAGSHRPDVVIIEGLYRAFPERVRIGSDDRPPILQTLNLYRERLRLHPVCIVIVLPEYALDLIARGSPDFWSWRSGVFSVQPVEASTAINAGGASQSAYGGSDGGTALSLNAAEAELARLNALWSERFDMAVSNRDLSSAARIAERLVGVYHRLARFARSEEWRGRAIDLLQRVTGGESDPLTHARAWNRLGTLWNESPLGDFGRNQYRAIAAYEAALALYARDVHPIEWAGTQNNLGNAWSEMPTGDRGENLRKAVSAYEAALLVYTRDAHPNEWAMAQNNLAAAWTLMPTGDRGENLQKAIVALEAALTVRTREDHPIDWATTQNNLAIAWRKLPAGDRGRNLRRSISAFEAALKVYTRDTYPADWATTQHNRAVSLAALSELPGEDRCGLMRHAIAVGKAAMIVLTPEMFPHQHASTEKNLQIDRAAYESGGCAEALSFDGIAPEA